MLDPRLLRAFVAIADAGSFTEAAERLNMTQSTISQQLARLEMALGHVLIDRAARPIAPTARGERLLGYARRILSLGREAEAALGQLAGASAIRLGVPEDLVAGTLAAALRRFAEQHREMRLDVTAGLSLDLMRRYRAGELDIAVVKAAAAHSDRLAHYPEPVAWFEGLDRRADSEPAVPLITFPPGGLYRDTMFARIEEMGQRWYVAFSGSSLESVLVAVEAGLGIALLPVSATRGRRLRRCAGLGAEPPLTIALYTRETVGPTADLARALDAVLAQRPARADLVP